MTSPTIRIRLTKQPPLYLVAAVVIASLLPVLFQFVPDASSVVTLQRLPELVAASVDIDPPRLVDAPSFEPAFELEPEDQVVILAEAESEADETGGEAPERAVKRNVGAESSRRVAPARSDETTPAHSWRGPEQRGKAACAARNKAAARDAYRALPLGDDRRRTIRKACRESGILIL